MRWRGAGPDGAGPGQGPSCAAGAGVSATRIVCHRPPHRPGPHAPHDRRPDPCMRHACCWLVHRRSSRKRGLAGACSRMWAWACCCCRPAPRASLYGSPRGGKAQPRGCCARWLCTIWRYVQVRTRVRPGTMPPPRVTSYVSRTIAPEAIAMRDMTQLHPARPEYSTPAPPLAACCQGRGTTPAAASVADPTRPTCRYGPTPTGRHRL